MRLFKENDFTRLKTSIIQAFKKIREEFDDHRESINQNTNEIQSNYEYLCQLDSKIEKLAERIDELTMFLEPNYCTEKNYNIKELTKREKEVFLVLYTADKEIDYKEIGRKTGLTENLVVCYVSNLITKGIPIVKRYVNENVVIYLDPEFKIVQMRQNIVKINESISQTIKF